MKRISVLVTFTVLFISCSKDPVNVIEAEPVSKTIEFRITPTADFNDPYFNNSFAEVKLQVYKQNSDPFSVEIIWDTVIAKQPLKNYMQMPNPNIIIKTFADIKEDKYRLGVGYEKRYYSGTEMYPQYSAMGEPTPYGNIKHRVDVGL